MHQFHCIRMTKIYEDTNIQESNASSPLRPDDVDVSIFATLIRVFRVHISDSR